MSKPWSNFTNNTIYSLNFFLQLLLSVVVTPVRRSWSLSHTTKVPSLTHSVMLWLPVLKDTHWRLPRDKVLRRLLREPRSSLSSRSSTTTTCYQPDTLWMLKLSRASSLPKLSKNHLKERKLRRLSRRPLKKDTKLVRTNGSSLSWTSKLNSCM